MHAQKSTSPRRHSLLPALIATTLLVAVAGRATAAEEPSPYYIGASQSFTHDSNVFRTPGGTGDNYSSTGLLGGFDQMVSRQRFYGAANVRYNKYQDQTTLDNTSYGVNAGWDWATIEKLSGNLNLSANQSLATSDNNAVLPLTTRNILNTDQFSTSVRWGGDALLTLDGSYAHSRVRYSAPEYLSSQSSADSGSIGASYRLGPDIRLGSAIRLSRTVSPFAVPLTATPAGPDDYRSNTSNGRNLDLVVDWRSTPQTGVNARLSWTRQTNSGADERDFSGLTGALAATYAATAKLAFNASASRDAGTNSSFFNFTTTPNGAPIRGLNENSQTTDSFALGANYLATAKITLNAGAFYSRAKLVNSTALGNFSTGTDGTDKNRGASFGANYAITRSVALACNLSHQARSLSGAAGYSYTANVATCSAQLTLR